MAYVVRAPCFEGPIDVLHRVIAEHQVDILEVPLAPIVDEFVRYLHSHRQSLSLDAMSEFLLVASVLVELKSQRLLPGPDVIDEDEELVGFEERDLLLARLLECRAYAAIADVLSQMAEEASLSIPREVGLDDGFVPHAPDLLAGVTPGALADAYLRATAERPRPTVDLSHVTVDTATVAETVLALAGRLRIAGLITFRELTSDLSTRIDVIVHFLAVLELCKLGKLRLGQGTTFGELQIEWLRDEQEMVGAGVGAGLVDDYDG